MALETGSYLADLNTANPAGTDPKAQGDDHIRLLKSVLKNSFAGFAGAVIVTGTEAEGATANDYVVTVSRAPAGYTASMVAVFKATHANTGAATLKINALAAKPLKAVDGGALDSADIESGALCAAFYDGSDFLLISGNDRAARGGETYSGAHDFTAATARVATVGAGDNSTKAASTAYVDAADALKAPLASPALTGAPTAPTAAPGTNTTQVATTAFATQLAFQTALPVQSVPAVLYTNGSVGSWRSSFVGDSGAGGELGPVPAPAAGDAMKVLRGDGTWGEGMSAPHVIVRGPAIGLVSASGWRTVPLTSLDRNDGSHASVASNQVTLAAGTWHIKARVQVSANGSQTSLAAKTRIYNVSDAVEVTPHGVTAYDAGASDTRIVEPEIEVVVVLGSSKALRFEIWPNLEIVGLSFSTTGTDYFSSFIATKTA